MNKRIKKKRAQMSLLHIAKNVHTREGSNIIVQHDLLTQWMMPRMYYTALDPNKNGVCVWRKKNIKRALKYMYKRRNRHLFYKQMNLYYKNLR